MPLYLCQSGAGQSEPWRYGIQVYSTPFPIGEDWNNNATLRQQSSSDAAGAGNTTATLGTTSNATTAAQAGHTRQQQQQHHAGHHGGGRDLVVATWMPDQSEPHQRLQHRYSTTGAGHPIRRVRHAEIVLVDDVCVAYDRYWLRLRWPGHKGGFAGYIAMGHVSETKREDIVSFAENSNADSSSFLRVESLLLEDREAKEDAELDDPTREEERQETGSMPPSEPFDAESTTGISLICLRTGLAFQSSPAMKLMALYEDGVSPSIAITPFAQETVFCRICREGLHDDADEEQPVPSAADGGEDDGVADPSSHSFGEDAISAEEQDPANAQSGRSNNPDDYKKGPVQPHPPYSANADALQNPLLAPCECSGSMAFVHYLCVEQWRCRSRHPEAHHGLNCETCGTPYSLPPPSERPAQVRHLEQEDWLDAMPPHVMQALRQPHFWWQIGAALVRRRWLRPLAPVLMSPMVALYCRARRLLKKRGVARRRWACSLCRRRARWKCVRCLRSYYCSRQCQNVSWHIVHKHVCYKPVRFWWSVVVYGAAMLLLFPSIMRDPLMYDLGLCLVPVTFVIMGIIGGGFALVVKKIAALDIRGRMLEFAVLACTCFLSIVSWGLVRGFFGDSSACWGAFGSYEVPAEDIESWNMLRLLQKFLLQPARHYYLMWDNIPNMIESKWVKAALCTNKNPPACFEHLPNADPDFFLAEHGGSRCAADLSAISWLYIFAGVAFAGSQLWKRHDRHRRRQGRRPGRGEVRPHQD